MLNAIAAVTLRILLFRAGPQDFPHLPQLVGPMPAAGAAAYFLFWSMLLPPGEAILIALSGVGALAFVTHSLLSARGLANRFQQTYHALLAATAVLALLLVPPALAMAPVIREIAANPDLLKTPEQVQMPAVPAAMVNLIELWAFAVYTNVFRQAMDAWLLVGVLIALFVAFSTTLLTVVMTALLLPLVR
jgi:hypothetical protein